MDRATRRSDPQAAHTPSAPAKLPPPQPPPPPAPFSWSSSVLTMLTVLGAFVVLCTYASRLSTTFALAAARPVYGLYPAPVAAMLVGATCALICYLPTLAAVVTFLALYGTDIRRTSPAASADAPASVRPRPARVAWSLLHDGAATIKLALVVAPVYVYALGRGGEVVVENRALEAAAGGQLAAALMTLKIMMVGMKEIWDLVPMVVMRWDRDATRAAPVEGVE